MFIYKFLQVLWKKAKAAKKSFLEQQQKCDSEKYELLLMQGEEKNELNNQ